MKTIKITEEKYQELIVRINDFDRILDDVNEMHDIYLSDLSVINQMKHRLTDALNLEWNSDTYRYEAPKGAK